MINLDIAWLVVTIPVCMAACGRTNRTVVKPAAEAVSNEKTLGTAESVVNQKTTAAVDDGTWPALPVDHEKNEAWPPRQASTANRLTSFLQADSLPQCWRRLHRRH